LPKNVSSLVPSKHSNPRKKKRLSAAADKRFLFINRKP